ncbi:unnamed protein product [Rotaria sp. Silwood1]|nr:unnamed protein product [Rotaria sp. Silwood1]
MLKPERVTFSADDDEFNQFTNNDQLKSFLNDSLVHYSTDFIKSDQQESTSIKHSNSLDQFSSITMSSQQEQQEQSETKHEPSISAPPSLISEENPILNENNLHQFDALTLQQLAIGTHQNFSNINEHDIETSPSHSISYTDIQKEVDRVRQMKYGRTFSSPTSSLCTRLTVNPFNGTNNNINLSSLTQSVHFSEESNQTNCLPFSSTFITSIPESIVPISVVPSTTDDNHFIPIHHIESPSIEDREVFETFHIKQTPVPGIAIRQSVNSLNRNMSTSETDLIASLHRSESKQGLDNQSEHGTTYSGVSDDMIFNEWDKERNLFQDYINSLRTEIRVLLQERSEYQKQIETINNNLSEHKRLNLTQDNSDQTKFELLKKSLEEKNLVLEQLQKEYEIIKEKNTNLTRKISVLRCDAKAQTGVIDELKQKIAELTVDIQNHIIVKRRLEISMMTLESDCKMIDTERIRLTNDIKDVQLSKQDLEKLLQQANVQIAEQERSLLRERLNEVELEFRKTLDDRQSTTNMYEEQLQSLVNERDALVQQHVLQIIENQHEIEKLQEELAQFKRSSIPSHVDIPLNEDIQSLQKIIEQQSEELKDLSEKYLVVSSQLELQNEFHKQKKETEEKLKTYENQIQHLIHEHENLVEELQKKTSSTNLKIDNECQTDDQQHDKLTQINIKLKRVLQTFKDKIHRIVVERPELFINISEDTSERLDHLISTVEYQATQINRLQTDHASTIATYEEQLQTLIQERNALIEQPVLQSIDKQQESAELKQRLITKQDINEDNQSLKEIIQQQSDQLKEFNEKYINLLSQLESNSNLQLDFQKEKREMEERLINYENQIQNLIHERTNLLEEIQKHTSSPFQTTDHEKSTDEKLLKINIKLKRALQTFKDKIHRIVTDRPDLFTDVGEETSERLDHLIVTVDCQAVQIDLLKTERDELEKHLRSQIDELQSSLDACRYQIENERQIKTQQLVNATPPSDDISRSMIENYEKQIHQLQQKLSHNDEERSLLRERLNEVELEFRKTLDDHSNEIKSSHDIDIQCNISEELPWNIHWDDESTHRDIPIQEEKLTKSSNEDEINRLKTIISEIQLENENLKDLNSELYQRKLQTLDSNTDQSIIQFHNIDIQCLLQPVTIDNYVQTEIENEQYQTRPITSSEIEKNDWNNQILSLEIPSTTITHIIQETVDNETQTDEQLQDKLVQINNKLKRALQTIKDKIHQAIIEQPDLFPDTNDDTIDRLDHLISTIRNQTKQIHILQNEHEYMLNQLHQTEIQPIVPMDRDSEYENQIKSLIHERDILLEQNKQLEKNIQSNTDKISFHQTISNDNSTQTDFIQEEQHIDNTNIRENEESNITNRLFGFISNLTSSPSQIKEIVHNETQTDEQLQDKTIQINNKLKRALQNIKDRIHQIVIEQPELFTHINDDTIERLDHLIFTIRNQFTQINNLQNVYDQAQHEINQLQSSLEAYEHPVDSEHIIKTEKPVSTTSSVTNISQSTIEDYEKHLHQLQQKLSQNDEERSLLRERLNEVELEFRKTLDDRQSTTNMYEEQLQSLVHERDVLVQQHVLQIIENQHQIEKLQKELDQLKQPASIQSSKVPSQDDIKSLLEIIEQQSEQLRSLNEKYVAITSSQLESQAEFDRQRKQTEEQIFNYENQIQNLIRERTNLLEERQKTTSSPFQITDHEKQKDDQQYDKLLKINTKLKRVLQTFKEKIHRIANERPNLFTNISEETSERLDHLITIVENQAIQIETLQNERNEIKQRFQYEINEIQNSFDRYRQQIDNEYQIKLNEYISSSPLIVQKIETDIIDNRKEIQPLQTSNNNQWNDWFINSPSINDTEKQHREIRHIDIQSELLVDSPQSINKSSDSTDHQQSTVTDRLFGFFKNVTLPWSEQTTNDWDEQNSPIQFPSEEPSTEHIISSSLSDQNLLEIIKNKLKEFISKYPELFPNSNGDTIEVFDQLISIIRNFQNQIKDLQSSFDAYRYRMEHEHAMKIKELTSNDVFSQTIGLSIVEEYQKEIDELKEKLHENNIIYQRELQYVIEERDQAREQLQEKENYILKSFNNIESQTSFDIDCSLTESRLSECQSQLDVLLRERISLMEQIKQLAHQPIKQHVEIQTDNDTEPSPRSEQRVSRRVFEQEILAWSKESEQLKQYVKQIQIENKKLKDIILKLESIVHDYMHENDRLKQENQHLSFLSYTSQQTNDNQENLMSSSDIDICYLTLKCLTYEVAQRTSNTNEQSLLFMDNNEPYLKQRLFDTERQLKSIRIQNQRLKKQLETYTIQFKHIQHEMNIKIQELTTLKIETDRLRTSETQYRLEVDRLKADLQCNQVKFQQFEREVADLKLERMNTDSSSTNNLRELLELKERELKALKEKLDYTIQAHQLELQEAIKSNQFSLDNVQRFEQLDQRHQEKRKELETRLGKICKAIKPLIDNQYLLKDNSIIDIDELEELIADNEAQERVTTSLGPIRDCLGLLESQMKELQHNLIENHARRSTRWKYKVGFECLSCDSQWEVTHDIQNLQEACQDPHTFLESSRVEPMTGCSCPLIVDFIENDVRLCIDDLLDEVIILGTSPTEKEIMHVHDS